MNNAIIAIEQLEAQQKRESLFVCHAAIAAGAKPTTNAAVRSQSTLYEKAETPTSFVGILFRSKDLR